MRPPFWLLAFALLGACVHGNNVERLQAGMSREQVQAIMGPPDGSTHSPGSDCTYYTVLKDFWSRTPWSMSSRYHACFSGDRLETFGRVDRPESAVMTGQ